MKNQIFLAAMLLMSSMSFSQINADVGFSSRLSPTIKTGLEVPLNCFNAELGVRVACDNYHPVIGLQCGYSFIVDKYNQELRLAIGGFYHTGIMEPEKTVREQCIRFGGSIRFKWSVQVYCIGEWNGETGSIGIGYLFKKH